MNQNCIDRRFPANGISGLLIDIDGVLRIVSQPVPGAAETIQELRRRRMPFRLLTNTTKKSRSRLAEELISIGIDIQAEEIHTASSLAAAFLRRQGAKSCFLLLEGDARVDFSCLEGLEFTDEAPEYVVLGDLGDGFNAQVMNKAFRALLAGARLIAIQHNPSWTAEDGPRLDVGAWSTALEYASGQEAIVMGKPSRLAFFTPAQELGLDVHRVAMVGDDPDADMQGARRAGLKTIFVQTTAIPQRREPATEDVDYMLPSFAELPALLSQIGIRLP